MTELTANAVAARARGILDAAYHSFLVTTDENGEPSGRLVEHIKPADDLTIWIGTGADSRKTRQIEACPRVLLACQSPRAPGYTVLTGTARVHRDPEVRKSHWRETWRQFWPEGPLSERYVVLEIRCERVELVDLASNPIAPAPFGLTPAVVERASGEWRLLYPQPTSPLPSPT